MNAPEFTSKTYAARLAENYPLGETVLTVTATDRDDDEVRYRLLVAESVSKFFFMNPLTGQLSVSKPLTESSVKEYVVSTSNQARLKQQATRLHVS